MSNLAKKMISDYNKRKEWRKANMSWTLDVEKDIISLVVRHEKIVASCGIIFLSLAALTFILAFIKYSSVMYLVGIAGIALLSILIIPKARRLIILKPDPIQSIDRILITLFAGTILLIFGAAEIRQYSQIDISSSSTRSTDSSAFDKGNAAKEREKNSYKQDMKEENKLQREFYSQLSSPKILYKCKNGDFEHAYGATIGTYNKLLSKVIDECGINNFEIIKSDK